MTDLSELIARLETSSRADRKLDEDVSIALELMPERAWWSIDYLKAGMIPFFTSSVDTALGLASLLLHDHGRLSGRGRCGEHEKLFGCAIFSSSNYSDSEEPIGVGEHDLEPIAIVIAVIRAYEAKGVAA